MTAMPEGAAPGRPARPAPVVTDDSEVFWDNARAGRLVAQECGNCGRLRHPPRPMCPQCQSLAWEARELTGHGVVYSYGILHHPRHPAFDYPVVAVLVDLDEGLRLVSDLVGVEPADVAIGMHVQVTYAETAGEMAVPIFEPVERPA